MAFSGTVLRVVALLAVASPRVACLRASGRTNRCVLETSGDRPPAQRCVAARASVFAIGEDVLNVATVLIRKRNDYDVHPTDPFCKEEVSTNRAVDDVFQEVRCCATAKAKVLQIEEKLEYCDEREICWKSLEDVLPKALEHFKKQEEILCVTTTTTTTTDAAATTTSTEAATTTVASTSNNTNASDSNASKANDDDGAFELKWCVEQCLKEEIEKEACDNFCERIHTKVGEKFEERLKEKVKKTEAEFEEKIAKSGGDNQTDQGNKSSCE